MTVNTTNIVLCAVSIKCGNTIAIPMATSNIERYELEESTLYGCSPYLIPPIIAATPNNPLISSIMAE